MNQNNSNRRHFSYYRELYNHRCHRQVHNNRTDGPPAFDFHHARQQHLNFENDGREAPTIIEKPPPVLAQPPLPRISANLPSQPQVPHIPTNHPPPPLPTLSVDDVPKECNWKLVADPFLCKSAALMYRWNGNMANDPSYSEVIVQDPRMFRLAIGTVSLPIDLPVPKFKVCYSNVWIILLLNYCGKIRVKFFFVRS